ncbi:MAG TPA: hypothetical protein VEY51_20790, partial [Chondromyces sp.]|nr:hypothetical protein [Chondromyces sp.]
MDERIVQAEEFVKSTLENESSGHDWHHLDRVRRNALKISKEEQKGDLLVIELAALLHDLPDEKLQDTVGNGEVLVNEFLESISIELNQKEHIKEIIDTISYNGGDEKPLCSFEAEAV